MKTEHSLKLKPKITQVNQRPKQLFMGRHSLHFAIQLLNKYRVARNLTKWPNLIWLKLFGFGKTLRYISINSPSYITAHYNLWFNHYYPSLVLNQEKRPGLSNRWEASNHLSNNYPEFIPGKQPGSSYLSRLVKNYPAVNYWELILETQLKSNYRWPLTNYFYRTNWEFILGKHVKASRFSQIGIEVFNRRNNKTIEIYPGSRLTVLDLLNYRPFNANITTPGQAGINQIGIYQTGNDKIALNHPPVFSRSNQEIHGLEPVGMMKISAPVGITHLKTDFINNVIGSRHNRFNQIITINFVTGLFNGSRPDYQNSYIARARGGQPPHQPSGSTRYSPYLITRNKLNYQSYESYQSFNYDPFSQADRTSGSTRADWPKVSRYSANTRGNLHRYHNLSNQIVTNYPLAYRIGRAQILLNTVNNPQLKPAINLYTLNNHYYKHGSEKSPFQTIRDQTGARENHPDILISGKPGGFNRLQPVVQSVNPSLEGQSKNQWPAMTLSESKNSDEAAKNIAMAQSLTKNEHKFTQLEYSRNNIFQLQSEKQSSEAKDIPAPNSSGIMPGLASIALDNLRPGPAVIREPGTVNREQSNQFWRAITAKYPPASGPGFLNGFIHFQRGGNRQNLVTAWNVNRMVMLSHLLKTENSLTAMSTAQTISGFNNSLASGPFFNPAELILRKTAAAESEINPETNEITVKPDKLDTSPQSSQNITLINNILQNIATRGGSFSAINVIANHVYQLIEKRIIIERDRRGLL